VTRANASPFGLSASVWSRSSERAARVAERLTAGSVSINDVIVTAGMVDVPHGGVGASGFGRSHGVQGLEECVRTKTIVIDRVATWRQGWWFGYSRAHAEGVDAFVRVAHSPRLAERLLALPRFLSFLFRPTRPL
jgi:aldehyde dehydrogenase (NAD+)